MKATHSMPLIVLAAHTSMVLPLPKFCAYTLCPLPKFGKVQPLFAVPFWQWRRPAPTLLTGGMLDISIGHSINPDY